MYSSQALVTIRTNTAAALHTNKAQRQRSWADAREERQEGEDREGESDPLHDAPNVPPLLSRNEMILEVVIFHVDERVDL